MEGSATEIWSKVLDRIEKEVGTQGFQTWFGQSRAVSLKDNCLTVCVLNRFFKDWLIEHYWEAIDKARISAGGENLKIEFTVGEGDSSPGLSQPAYGDRKASVEKILGPESVSLNPKYTFDNFVIGPCNSFAHAASLAVAESLGKAYNPLFIHGRTGLGKTHLMQAIGHYVTRKRPGTRTIYLSAEKFTNQLISAIQNRTTTKFRERYRNADLLLLDDIHFLAKKGHSQEEFFHTFNTLYDAHKQIVVSSDRSPREISAMEERLISRFCWGLTIEIGPPELETRVAILKKKLERERVRVEDDIINFIAEYVKTNIRELEGALIRVMACSLFTGKPVTLSLARDVLKESISINKRMVNLDAIMENVAVYFGMRQADLRAKKRQRNIVYPRQIAMYLCREMSNYSLPEIGGKFGGMNHTTVLHACDRIKENLKKDGDLKKIIQEITQQLQNK